MADFEVEGSIVQVKKCTVFIGSNSSGKSEIVKLLLKTLDDQCDPDEELKWIQAVTLTKDGECRPIGDNTEIEAVQNKMKDDSCFSLTCSILIDAEGLKEVPIPKCHVSSLATGLGGYFIVFPLDSFAEEASDDSKAKLVEEIFESMHVIKESVPRTAPEEIDKGLLKPQVVLVGTHHGSDAPKASNWREVANDRLKRKLNGNEAHYNLMLKDGSRDVVWDVDVTDKDENSTLSTPLPSVSEVDFPMEFSWMEAYKILGGIFKKRTNKRLSKNQCLQFFRKKKLQIQNLDKMLSVFNLLGWFVTHDNAVFDRSYLCAKIQKLVRQGKIPDGEEIGELLANKGLATKCAGEYVITCMLPERADQNPRISASLLYLTVEHGHVMSVDVFWKLVNEVLKVKHWETRSPPTCSNYITLQYHTLFVHLTYIDGVIEVAVEKPIQARGSEAKSLKRFADNCGKIRESLIGSLENLKGDRCKWGFACNEDHLIGDYNPCLSRCVCVTRSDTFNPNEYLFKCHFDKHSLPALTLRHEVWFTTKLLGSHHVSFSFICVCARAHVCVCILYVITSLK